METEARSFEEDDELRKMLTEWDVELDSHWAEWEREARENFDIWAGRSWSKEERADMEAAGRVPVEFNQTAPLIKAVVGAEIAGRLRVDYQPRTIGDAKVNEVLTSGAEYIRDKCDAEGEETDAFLDALICGIGVTETRLDFEEDPEGQILEEKCDPLEFRIQPSASKKGAQDAKYIRRKRMFSRREAEERFGEEDFGEDDEGRAGYSVDDPRNYYEDTDEREGRDEVVVTEYQWWELKRSYIVSNPAVGVTLTVTPEEFEELSEAARESGREFQYAEQKQRIYRRAFKIGSRLTAEELPTRAFTYDFITGDRDRNKGVWFGLVRPMSDPQKWANKFFSHILHILKTNAKGGILAEEGAIEDMTEFEETWASGDSVTTVKEGALRNKLIQPKPMAQYPQGLDRLMEVSEDKIRKVAGVNPEFLGQAEQNQPGVLEHQRKQAAYGIMGTFFDSLRRFRRSQGTKMLRLIAYLPSNFLIKVSQDDWENPQYVQLAQLALDPERQKYDVIVDDAPSGPNQQERTFSLFLQLLPVLKDLMTPEMFVEMLRNSPFPTSFVEKISQQIQEAKEKQAMEQQKPEVQIGKQLALEGMQLEVQGKALENAGKQADIEQTQVETVIAATRPDPRPQVSV